MVTKHKTVTLKLKLGRSEDGLPTYKTWDSRACKLNELCANTLGYYWPELINEASPFKPVTWPHKRIVLLVTTQRLKGALSFVVTDRDDLGAVYVRCEKLNWCPHTILSTKLHDVFRPGEVIYVECYIV